VVTGSAPRATLLVVSVVSVMGAQASFVTTSAPVAWTVAVWPASRYVVVVGSVRIAGPAIVPPGGSAARARIGNAILTEPTTTTYLDAGHTATVHATGALVITKEA